MNRSRDPVDKVTRAFSDPWKTLGVSQDADEKEIKRAHRKLVLQNHPDITKDDPSAEARFLSIQEAYEIVMGRRRGKEADASENGNGWSFHDWYWRFKASKRWGKKGARAGPNPFASTSPPPQDQWKSQLHGLKRKAAAKRAQQQGRGGSTAPQESAWAQSGARHPSAEADVCTDTQRQTSKQSSASAATQPQQPKQARHFRHGSQEAGLGAEADLPWPGQPLRHDAQLAADASGLAGVPSPDVQGQRGPGHQAATVCQGGAGSASWVPQQQHYVPEQACQQQHAATAAAASGAAWAAAAAASTPTEEPLHHQARFSHALPPDEHSRHQQGHQQQRQHHYQGGQQAQQLGQVLPFLGQVVGRVHRLREQSSGALQNHAVRLARQASQLGEHLQVQLIRLRSLSTAHAAGQQHSQHSKHAQHAQHADLHVEFKETVRLRQHASMHSTAPWEVPAGSPAHAVHAQQPASEAHVCHGHTVVVPGSSGTASVPTGAAGAADAMGSAAGHTDSTSQEPQQQQAHGRKFVNDGRVRERVSSQLAGLRRRAAIRQEYDAE
ncbi:hypothetical protein N2152v2_006300 [Parachlorella kessleri]